MYLKINIIFSHINIKSQPHSLQKYTENKPSSKYIRILKGMKCQKGVAYQKILVTSQNFYVY